MTLYIVRTQAVLSLACTKLYHINPRRDEFKVQDNAVLLQIMQLYIMFCLLSGLTSALGGFTPPHCWHAKPGSPQQEDKERSKSPPRSTVPKSLTQKTGSYVFGSGSVLQKRFPTDVRESQLMVPEITFPMKQKAASHRPV